MIKPISRGETEHGKTFAKGGSGHMLGRQASNPQKPGVTAHAVKGKAPGAKFASGGKTKVGFSPAKAAAPGCTGPVRKAR